MGASREEVSAGDGREISNVCWEDLPGMRAVCLQTEAKKREGGGLRDGGRKEGRRKDQKGSILVWIVRNIFIK